MNLPIFKADDWQVTAEGVWEARAKPRSLDGRAPFEASCYAVRSDVCGRPCWTYQLFQPAYDQPDGALELIADGPANTLADAQRQADLIGRRHRDRPSTQRATDAK